MCEVYFAQDHSVSGNVEPNLLEQSGYGEERGSFTGQVSSTVLISLYFSRAPPLDY